MVIITQKSHVALYIFAICFSVGMELSLGTWDTSLCFCLDPSSPSGDVTLDFLTSEVIFINDGRDLPWMVLCLLFHKKAGAPALYFICHCCFSVLQQCPIVSMKFSGSLKRRILYYYVPAKFRPLFSFCCSQRAHKLLSAARPATKLHCCLANRPVSVDGSARCEICLSAVAAGGSLGMPSLR